MNTWASDVVPDRVATAYYYSSAWHGISACVPAKVVGIATAGTHKDGRSFAKGTKKRLYPWPAFFTCTAFYRTGTPFSARAIHFTRSQNALLKTTSRDPFHCREYALSPGDVRPQAFPSTVSSKFCTYSKSFFFSSPKQNGSIVNRSSAALFRTSTNPGKMMLL